MTRAEQNVPDLVIETIEQCRRVLALWQGAAAEPSSETTVEMGLVRRRERSANPAATRLPAENHPAPEAGGAAVR